MWDKVADENDCSKSQNLYKKVFIKTLFFGYFMRSYWPISYVFNICLPANTDKYISAILIFTYSNNYVVSTH